MDFNINIWNIFIALFGLMIIIYAGFIISNGITSPKLYAIFWIMYSITIITFITIGLSIIFYLDLSYKTGPQGFRGEIGDNGDKGEAGLCEEGCHGRIAIEKITEALEKEINKLANYPSPEIELHNLYIKERIKQICNSPEFKQLVPYRGPNDLIDYLIKVWKIWAGLLYKAGGRKYFETIGAENEFEWISNNPFDEIKKYDVFYWGMGKEYRPNIIEKCTESSNKNKIKDGQQKGWGNLNMLTKDHKNAKTGSGWSKTPKKHHKYSILDYINKLPESKIVNSMTKNKYKLISIQQDKPNTYFVKAFNPKTEKYEKCVSKYLGNLQDCDINNKNHLWGMKIDDDTIKLKSKQNNKFLKAHGIKGSQVFTRTS